MRRDEAGGGEPETEPLLSCLLTLSGTTAVFNFIFIFLNLCILFQLDCMKGEVLKKRRVHRLVEPQIQEEGCDCPGHGQQQPFKDNQYP